MITTVLTIAACVLAGIFSWSFCEYLLHRFLGHACKGRNHMSREHLAHHTNPDYFAPTWQKVLVAIAWFIGVTALTSLVFGSFIAVTYSFCFAAMYGFYEVVHRRIHTHAPMGPYGRMVRKHHLAHHFTDARQCHGVTSRLWDRVFGTNEAVSTVRIPRKLAMPWMLGANGELRERFVDSYLLVGRPAATAEPETSRA
jgi:sterol desaturase/sphingolipid hydroxylase (fatty acid hydroxylase superfamily)